MFSDKFKKLRKEKHMTQSDIARQVGVTYQAVGKWERGESTPDYEALNIIAKIFDVSTDYLIGKPFEGQDSSAFLRFSDQLKKVPILGRISCGLPILAQQNIEGYTYSSEPSADFALVAKGDSMIGRRIHDGDIVLVKQTESVESGEVAAVLLNNEATLKILHHTPDGIILSAANEKYPPIIVRDGDCDYCRILGKAVAFQGKL